MGISPPHDQSMPARDPQNRLPLVLVAEDDQITQIVTQQILNSLGYRVYIANNGKEAVQSWSRIPFDMILMDFDMPELNGIEAAKLIRQAEKDRQTQNKIPILIVSTHSREKLLDLCQEAEMDGIIAKPLSSSALISALASIGKTIQLHST
jgi:CheY-like chemotaxis protein